jgi:phosphatidate cytidylyltransferase
MIVRVITGVVLAPLIMLLLYKGPLPVIGAVFAAAGLIGVVEFYRMALKESDASTYESTVGLIGTFILLAATWTFGEQGLAAGMIAAVMGVITALLFKPGAIETVGQRISWLLAGIAYVGGLFAVLVLFADLGENRARGALFVLCLAVWGGDTFAYFFGKFLGKKKLYPLVSPKKTWMGAFGGLLGSVTGAVVVGLMGWKGLSTMELVLVGLAAGVVEQIGDLGVSLFKRSVGAKDSGSIFPGHGGMLDRVDGLMFAAPVVYIFVRYVSL